jgi:bis(5'-nucleosyl)-tetraphosphatase (symmetrical)
MDEQKIIVVGDIHGCVDEFKELVVECDYRQGIDRLILLGDLVDRGPDPAGVIRLARELGAECVLGNHEESALRWRKHEKKVAENPKYKNPMRARDSKRLAQWASIPDEDWDWIAKLPYYIRLDGNWVAVHAGAMPGVPFEKQDPNHLMRIRYIDNTTKKMVPMGGPDQPNNSTFWAELWDGPENILFGHFTVDDVYEVGSPTRTVKTYGIDTGCCHGKMLTAAILIEGKPQVFMSIAAREEYSPRKNSWANDG